jgi:hypothetical protein
VLSLNSCLNYWCCLLKCKDEVEASVSYVPLFLNKVNKHEVAIEIRKFIPHCLYACFFLYFCIMHELRASF